MAIQTVKAITSLRFQKELRRKDLNKLDLMAHLRLDPYKIKMTPTEVGRIVNGTYMPEPKVKRAICKILGVEQDYLFPEGYTVEQVMAELMLKGE